jgi:hypothetical protein
VSLRDDHDRLRRARLRSRLHRYTPEDRSSREIVLLEAAKGSRLLVDRSLADRADALMLAHLGADEPDLNASFVCRDYLANGLRPCRRALARDLLAPADGAVAAAEAPVPVERSTLEDARGARYRLAVAGTPRELRWQRIDPEPGIAPRIVSARCVVAAIEDYEPVRALTRAAIGSMRANRQVSVATLGLELRRLEASPIVLNRRLREAVLDAVRERGISLSAIAIACGRTKRDPRGNGSGETSWLARRVGLTADGAGCQRNPWVHSDTLALIARDGLGIAPREVELG